MNIYLALLAISFRYCNVGAVTVESLTPSYGLAEGPHWDAEKQLIFFVDIFEQKLLSYNITSRVVNSALIRNGPVGVAVSVEGSENQHIVGSGRDILLVTWDGKMNVTNPPIRTLASLDLDRSDTRINDGKVDPNGRLWIGTMGPENNGVAMLNRGSLYSVGNNFRPKKQIAPVSISNGLAWNSANDTMYYIDSPTRQIVAYNFSASNGTIANKTVVFDLQKNKIKGFPDGMTIDSNDNLWIALFSGGRVIQVDPKQGKMLSSVELPAERVTSVTFGGPKLDTLYVTTSSFGLTANQKQQQPKAGSLFAVTGLNVKGRPTNTFKMQK